MKFLKYLLLAVFLTSGVLAYADSTDSLIDSLVSKGVLTNDEAKQIKATPSSVPAWINNLTFSGDFRNRLQDDLSYDSTNKNSNGTFIGYNHRDRDRIRLRFGVETKVVDNVKVGFGLATLGAADTSAGNVAGNSANNYASASPRSRNWTLGYGFANPLVGIDYAYAEYAPSSLVAIDFGKMKSNPVWNTSDMLWDPDLTYDGVAVKLKKDFTDDVTATLNGGLFIFDEDKISASTTSASNDGINGVNNGIGSKAEYKYPSMYFVQPTVAFTVSENIMVKAGVAYYYTMNIASNPVLNAAGNNSPSKTTNTTAHGAYAYSYNDLNPSVEIMFSNVLDALPMIDLSADQARNPDPTKYNNSYSATVKIGDKAVNGFGKWQLAYIHKYLEKDAWLDAFTDDDTYSGKTNVVGAKEQLQFGLTKSMYFVLSYYKYDVITGKTSRTATELTQADINVKF